MLQLLEAAALKFRALTNPCRFQPLTEETASSRNKLSKCAYIVMMARMAVIPLRRLGAAEPLAGDIPI
jgi:hypothetical protein